MERNCLIHPHSYSVSDFFFWEFSSMTGFYVPASGSFDPQYHAKSMNMFFETLQGPMPQFTKCSRRLVTAAS